MPYDRRGPAHDERGREEKMTQSQKNRKYQLRRLQIRQYKERLGIPLDQPLTPIQCAHSKKEPFEGLWPPGHRKYPKAEEILPPEAPPAPVIEPVPPPVPPPPPQPEPEPAPVPREPAQPTSEPLPPVAPPASQQAPWFRQRYGVVAPIALSGLQLEQACFLNRQPTEKGGLGRYRHFKNMTRLIWPEVSWNPWLCDQIRELCNDDTASISGDVYVKTVAMTGAAAAGKSFSAGFFAVAWWRCAPMESAVIVCSTQKDMLKKRVWDPISNFHVTAIDPHTKKTSQAGRLIDSRTKIVWEDALRSDEKHGIFGLAVAGGETIKAVQEIKGIHARRVMVIVDEAEATPEAIFEAIPNLRKGCKEFILVVLGNSVSRMDPHGIICTPAKGWSSVSVDMESWPTKGVPRWQIEPGTCLHFDGTKSPNVQARRTQFPYLYSWEDFLAASNKPDYAQSTAFWQHDRGFWAPEGLSDTIFTETMIEKYDGQEFKFESFSTPIAFLDPAFGGDDCKLLFGTLGNIVSGKLALQITHNMTIPINAESKDEVDYQVARRTIAECKKRHVQPRQFGLDAVGIGRGVAAIIAGEWSSEIHRVESTGAPTERPSSTADGRPAKEVYDRLATEFWWSAREILQGGQLRGFYRELIVQLCARTYTMKGRKYSMETKEDFKARIKRSPDDADSCVGICEVARRNGLNPATSIAKRKDTDWSKTLAEGDKLHEDPPLNSDSIYDTEDEDEYAYA